MRGSALVGKIIPVLLTLSLIPLTLEEKKVVGGELFIVAAHRASVSIAEEPGQERVLC